MVRNRLSLCLVCFCFKIKNLVRLGVRQVFSYGIRIYKFLVKKIEPQRHNAASAAHKEDGNEMDRTPL